MKSTALPKLGLRMLLAVFGAILLWLVISRSLVAYLADAAPQTALWLSPRNPEALTNLADQAINGVVTRDTERGTESVAAQPQQPTATDSTTSRQSDGDEFENLKRSFAMVDKNRTVDLPTVREQAQSALIRRPLNAHALRILGQVADASHDEVGATSFMEAAARLSLHDSIADYRLMTGAAKKRDYKTAVYYADVLLRTQPEFVKYVVPILAQIAEDKNSVGLLKSVLAADPPWRDDFFAILPNDVTDARTPLDLLVALRTTSTPPTNVDINYYLSFLIGHEFYDLAYYTWLQFLPVEQLRHAGLLFNGDFNAAPSGLPFDWKITPGAGVTIDVVPTSDSKDEHALLIDFQYGRVDYRSVQELVMLTPGTYEFKGKYKGSLVGPRGLSWRVTCANEKNHSRRQ